MCCLLFKKTQADKDRQKKCRINLSNNLEGQKREHFFKISLMYSKVVSRLVGILTLLVGCEFAQAVTECHGFGGLAGLLQGGGAGAIKHNVAQALLLQHVSQDDG